MTLTGSTDGWGNLNRMFDLDPDSFALFDSSDAALGNAAYTTSVTFDLGDKFNVQSIRLTGETTLVGGINPQTTWTIDISDDNVTFTTAATVGTGAATEGVDLQASDQNARYIRVQMEKVDNVGNVDQKIYDFSIARIIS